MEPYLGSLRIFPFAFAPRGWARCDGQLLPINQNQALYSLLGTIYGGDGQTTFALPDLRGRVPLAVGPEDPVGAAGGAEQVTLGVAELPAHTHPLTVSGRRGTSADPAGLVLAAGPAMYAAPDGATLAAATVGQAGSPAPRPHDNLAPSLVLNVCIALQGAFPTRN